MILCLPQSAELQALFARQRPADCQSATRQVANLRYGRFMGSFDLRHWTRISSWKEDRLLPRWKNSPNGETSATMEIGLPLPKGEGWGEGERSAIRDENVIFFQD